APHGHRGPTQHQRQGRGHVGLGRLGGDRRPRSRRHRSRRFGVEHRRTQDRGARVQPRHRLDERGGPVPLPHYPLPRLGGGRALGRCRGLPRRATCGAGLMTAPARTTRTAAPRPRTGGVGAGVSGAPDGPARRLRWWIAGGLAVLLATWVFSITIGPAGSVASDLPPLRPGDVFASAWHHVQAFAARMGIAGDPGDPPLSAIREAIIWQGRAPRILVASAVGAGLALAGAVMQSVVRNPLADPYLLGLSSGASLGAVAVLVLGASVALPVAAFVGAMAALALTLALAGRAGTTSPGRMVLAGVAVAQGASALVSFTIFSTVRGDSYREILTWLLGSVSGATWSSVLIAGGALIVVGPLILGASRTL